MINSIDTYYLATAAFIVFPTINTLTRAQTQFNIITDLDPGSSSCVFASVFVSLEAGRPGGWFGW